MRASQRTEKRSMTLPKMSLDIDVWAAAKERMRHAYKIFDHIAVSFSGGKDSTAVLHTALEVAEELGRLPLRVVFWDEEAIPYETEDYIRRVGAMDGVALEWYCVPVKHRNACSMDSPFWVTWNPAERDAWVRPLPPEAITEIPGLPLDAEHALSIPEQTGLYFGRELGRCGVAMGIRAAESLVRQKAVTRRTHENYIIPVDRGACPTLAAPQWKVYPIYDWSTEDVWTAPARFGWDYNRAYDAMEMAGISHGDQRCAPPYGEEPMRGLWMFKTCFPDVWDRMHDRVPGAATAARYSMTALYAFGEVPAKPPDLSWRDHIAALVEAHPVEIRGDIASRVGQTIRRHFVRVDEPILPYAAHPETGVSWNALLSLATRGDLKSRRSFIPPLDPKHRARLRAAYDDERLRLESELGRALRHDETGDMV